MQLPDDRHGNLQNEPQNAITPPVAGATSASSRLT
jgi:hypothetical protein